MDMLGLSDTVVYGPFYTWTTMAVIVPIMVILIILCIKKRVRRRTKILAFVAIFLVGVLGSWHHNSTNFWKGLTENNLGIPNYFFASIIIVYILLTLIFLSKTEQYWKTYFGKKARYFNEETLKSQIVGSETKKQYLENLTTQLWEIRRVLREYDEASFDSTELDNATAAEIAQGMLDEIKRTKETALKLSSQQLAKEVLTVLAKLRESLRPVLIRTAEVSKDKTILLKGQGAHALLSGFRDAWQHYNGPLEELAAKVEAEKEYESEQKIIPQTELDEVDNKIIELYEKSQEQHIKMPSNQKIAAALYNGHVTQKELSREAIRKRTKRLRQAGLIGSPDDNKDVAKRCTDKHIEDLDGRGQTRQKF